MPRRATILVYNILNECDNLVRILYSFTENNYKKASIRMKNIIFTLIYYLTSSISTSITRLLARTTKNELQKSTCSLHFPMIAAETAI